MMEQSGWLGKKLGAAAVISNREGCVLLVKHAYGRLNWELPGGAVEAGESVADAAVREVREETGLTVTPKMLTGIYYDAEADAHHFVYRCRLNNRDQEPLADCSEVTQCAYFPHDALPRPMSDFTMQRIREAFGETFVLLPVRIGPRQWLE